MSQNIVLRPPGPEDGVAVNQLISQCSPLDPNSLYCNLLQCSHFAETSIGAFDNDRLVGFISGYCVPNAPDTLFIWQVAVSKTVRGKGVATQMLLGILNRSHLTEVSYIETTITPNNEASWKLFNGLAQMLGAELNSSVMFERVKHFNGNHDSEVLVRIGPLKRSEV